jgi:presenilin-like A22 family membrane protease
MKYKSSLLIAVSIYLLVQGIGLWISRTGPGGGAGIIETVKEGEVLQPVVQNPENPESSLQIFLYVLVSTAVLLILLKYRLGFIIQAFIYFGLFGGLSLTLWGLIGDAGILLAIPLMIIAIWKRQSIVAMDALLILSIPGIGSWLGASLAFIPALILLIGLAVYDLIAVFGTKHMVTLAEGAKGKIPLMFAIPVGDRVLGLGTGDLVIPLVFSVSVLRDYSMTQAIAASLGGLLGLMALFFYILSKKDIVLPALPPITVGLILGYGFGLLLKYVSF